MMADLFWDVATSYAALSAIAAIGVVALIVGHVPFGKYAPVIGPYVVLARFLAYPALMLLAFLIGFRLCDDREEARQLKRDLTWAQVQLKQQVATSADKERLLEAARNKAAEADQKVSDYEEYLATLPQPEPKAGGDGPVCDCGFNQRDIDELHRINARARSTKAGRPNSPRLRGPGR